MLEHRFPIKRIALSRKTCPFYVGLYYQLKLNKSMLRDYSELMVINWLSACFISNGEFILSTTYSEFDIFNQFVIELFYDLIVEKRITI